MSSKTYIHYILLKYTYIYVCVHIYIYIYILFRFSKVLFSKLQLCNGAFSRMKKQTERRLLVGVGAFEGSLKLTMTATR